MDLLGSSDVDGCDTELPVPDRSEETKDSAPLRFDDVSELVLLETVVAELVLGELVTVEESVVSEE